MGKAAPKTSALVVSAIRKLREVQGSTPQEIMNYITTEYAVPASKVKRQLQAALKRGLEYGILKRQHGHYRLSTDAAGGATGKEAGGLIEKCGKRKYRKCKKTRRCARGCVPNRRKRKCGGKRRHSKRSRCPKRCRTTVDGDNLALDPLDGRSRKEMSAQRSHRSNRSTRSRTRSRSRSHSRSGHSSAHRIRGTSLDRRDKGAE